MRPKNKTTQLFIYIGIFLCTFGIGKLNTEAFSFEANQRAIWMLLGGVVSLAFSYYRNRKEKKSDGYQKPD